MTEQRLVLATRKSALALAQSRAFARELEACHPGLAVSEWTVVTQGDRVVDVPIWKVGGKGVFIREIEDALVAGQAHLAVHSFKDMPAEVLAPFRVVCVPARADARDALVARTGATLDSLPVGARVGTSSLRRSLQLRACRPDLEIVPLRGNVDTRLRKLDGGEFDAIVLAQAGLARLGLAERTTELLDPSVMLPAAAQGALAIECLDSDEATHRLLAPSHHPESAIAVSAERGVMAAVSGSCTVPFAAHACRAGADIWLRALLAAEDVPEGRERPECERVARIELRRPWPASERDAAELGRQLGQELLTRLPR